MRVSAVQFKALKGDPRQSRVALAALASQAARDADLVVLPEMAVTGYEFATADAVRAVAEVPDGPTCEALAAVARDRGCWLVGGFAERAGDALFNSALVLDPAGQLRFVYRKTLLFDADQYRAAADAYMRGIERRLEAGLPPVVGSVSKLM